MWCKGKLFFADRQILAHIFAKRQKENPAPQGKTGLMKGGVVPPGIEPGTHGFSVRCSTN